MPASTGSWGGPRPHRGAQEGGWQGLACCRRAAAVRARVPWEGGDVGPGTPGAGQRAGPEGSNCSCTVHRGRGGCPAHTQGAQGPGYQHTGFSQPFSPLPRLGSRVSTTRRPAAQTWDPGGQGSCELGQCPSPLSPCTDPRSLGRAQVRLS